MLLIFTGIQISAQRTNQAEEESLENTGIPCASDEIHSKLLNEDPEYAKNFYLGQELMRSGTPDNLSSSRAPILTIPVVVHIIHTGEPLGQGSNISDEQIYSAIVAANEDFRKMAGTNGDGIGVDTEMEFCLAVRDPDGNPSTGINRVDGSSVPLYATEGINVIYSEGASETAVKALSIWPKEDYYNIWIVNEIENNDGGSGIQGFAYFPGTTGSKDGAVILYNAFGTVGTLKSYTDLNRTTTHELGHGFNLYHTFQGNSCTETNCSTQGDRVCDTPPTTTNTSCGTPACSGTQMVENYMDYTSENCQNAFTQGQKDRMRSTFDFTSQRGTLLNSLGCSPVYSADIGVEDFTSPDIYSCATNISPEIKVRNYGSTAVTSFDVEYSIDGGSTQTYNYTGSIASGEFEIITLPNITTTIGAHNLSATASNPNGQTDQFPSNNSDSFSFETVDGNMVEVDIRVDPYGGDNTWVIVDASDNVLAQGGPYPNGISGTHFVTTHCLPAGCYDFTMDDSYGDGMIGSGGYDVTDQSGTLLAGGANSGDFEHTVTTNFCVTASSGAAPEAAFSATSQAVCAGNSISFVDQSSEVPTSWAWTFEGGTPSSSTAQNPGPIQYSSTGAYDVTLTVTNSNGTDTQVSTDYITVSADGMSASGTLNHPSCGMSNGSIAVSVSGGLSPYSFSWNNGASSHTATGLSAGTYSIEITDAGGCTITEFFTLNDAGGILITQENVTHDTNNSGVGAIDISASGGSDPYSYNWTGPDSFTATTMNIENLFSGVYTVIVTDDAGCSETMSITIDNIGIPVADFSADQVSICVGENIDFTDLTTGDPTTWDWTFTGANTTASSDQNPTGIAYSTPGTYTVSLTASNANGSSTEEKVGYITVHGAPTASATLLDPTCGQANGSIETVVSGGQSPYDYSWSNGATTSSLEDLSDGTYSVSISDANGCSFTDSYTLSAGQELVVSISNVTHDIGGAGIGSIDLNVDSGLSPFTFDWNGPDGFTATTMNIDNLLSGTYSVTVTDANACSTIVSVEVENVTLPVAEFTASALSICTGESITFTDLSTGGVTSWSWTFEGAETTSSSDQNPGGVQYLNAGTYSVTLAATNDQGTSTEVKTGFITVTESPVISYTAVDPTCGLSNGSITLTVTGGLSPYSFDWSNGGTDDVADNLSQGDYSVTVTDANGCSTTGSYTITENNDLQITVLGISNDLGGAGTGYIDIDVSGGVSPYTYAWTGPNGFTATSMNIDNLFEGTYQVTVTDDNGCTNDLFIDIENTPLFVADFESDVQTTCAGELLSFTDLSSPGVITWLWEFPGAANPTSTMETPLGIYYNNPGIYTVTLTVFNGTNQAVAVRNNYITILGDPQVSAEVEEPLCFGNANGSIDITVAGGDTPYSFEWSNSAISEDLSNVDAGDYSVVVTDANGCATNSSFTVEEPDVITINVIANVPDQNNTGSGAIDVEVTGGTSPYDMTWTESGSVIAVVEDIYDLLSGTYVVNVTDANGCTQVEEIEVLNFNAPTASFTSSTSVTCVGETIQFNDLSTGDPVTRLWDFPGGWPLVSTIPDPEVTYLFAGTYTASLTVVNVYGTDTYSATITINDALEVSYVSIDPLCHDSDDGEIDITVTGGSGNYDYLWSSGSTFEDLDLLADGTYYLLVGDENACTARDTIELFNPEALEISVVNQNPDSCNLGVGMVEISAVGGNPGYTVQWDDPSGQTDMTLDNVTEGTYNVMVTDANQCIQDLTVEVDAEICSGIEENLSILNDIVLYPNPSSGERLYLIVENSYDMNIFMYDVTGRQLDIQLFVVGENLVELIPHNSLSNGIYFVKFKLGESEITKKVTVNK